MKKLIACLFLMALLLVGCYSTIAQVENRYGPPGKVEDREDTTIYYYYFYRGYVNTTGTEYAAGLIVWEITTDKTGKVLHTRKYWKQP